jgi:hypothetical protein
LVLFVVLVAIYESNGRDLGTSDTVPTSLVPLAILRGQGFFLDSHRVSIEAWTSNSMDLAISWHGHLLSRYPIAPALLIVPLYAPQVALNDHHFPGWDHLPRLATDECRWMAKRSLVILMASAAVIMQRLLIRLGLGRAALTAVIAAFLGSDLWTVGSQALWQHGPAAFCLVCAIALLHPEPSSRWRLALAGLATTFLVGCRLSDVVFALVIVLWIATTQPRGLVWFLPIPILGAIALFAYNLYFFGTITGGLAALEELHPQVHGMSGTWSGGLVDGALGTLFSPNRGLFVFSPWVALGLLGAAVPAIARRVASHRLICWLLWALLPYLIIYSKYAVWWGGHCFGPRYWTDVIPLFAILFAFALDWMLDRSRALVALAWSTIIWSIAVQSIGAFCYPSTWNLTPANVDLHHERLWDWRDSELSRCVIEELQRGSR